MSSRATKCIFCRDNDIHEPSSGKVATNTDPGCSSANAQQVVGASTSRASAGDASSKIVTEVFTEYAGESRAKAIACTSVTDKVFKKGFAEKDMKVMSLYHSEKEATQYLDTLKLGYCCKKGLKPDAPNQDTYSIHVVDGKFALFGVYDGHGPFGHDVSDLARQFLVKSFFEDATFLEQPKRALAKAFMKSQTLIESEKDLDSSLSGTTCSVAFYNALNDDLTIAHVGDSRAVIATRRDTSSEWQIVRVTEDHNPELPAEKARIESANPPGVVVFDGAYNHRVFAKDNFVVKDYPGLNMSRALGDVIAHKEAGVTARPDIVTINLTEHKDSNLEVICLLCTDGVWEFIQEKGDNKGALDIITQEFTYKKRRPKEVANKLAEKSWDEWMKDSNQETSDDITVMMIPIKMDVE